MELGSGTFLELTYISKYLLRPKFDWETVWILFRPLLLHFRARVPIRSSITDFTKLPSIFVIR